MDVQYGQAAVLTPSDSAFARDGIAAEADSNEETVLVCDLDLDALHAARSSGTVTPRLDRRADMFRYVSRMSNHWDVSSIPSGHGPLGAQPLTPLQFGDGVEPDVSAAEAPEDHSSANEATDDESP
jgi:hypothetical protein